MQWKCFLFFCFFWGGGRWQRIRRGLQQERGRRFGRKLKKIVFSTWQHFYCFSPTSSLLFSFWFFVFFFISIFLLLNPSFKPTVLFLLKGLVDWNTRVRPEGCGHHVARQQGERSFLFFFLFLCLLFFPHCIKKMGRISSPVAQFFFLFYFSFFFFKTFLSGSDRRE